uniref:Uncharacterized protein n=1 Tax=Arundo donax TaxID=35708 RepID=A0A0A8YG47_ARUDO
MLMQMNLHNSSRIDGHSTANTNSGSTLRVTIINGLVHQ